MEDANHRLDKWLWQARFYKTRSLATAAINGGQRALEPGAGKAPPPRSYRRRLEPVDAGHRGGVRSAGAAAAARAARRGAGLLRRDARERRKPHAAAGAEAPRP